MKYLYSLFFENIKKNNLIKKGDTVLSAFSGGKDSVTLLVLLKKLQNDIDFKLKALYFNHNLRKDSDKEEEWVESYIKTMDNIELVKGSSDVKTFKEKNRINLENAASILRYDFFNDSSKKFTNPKIATGHSRSDLSETFFIKLFRGSGLQGLSGIFGFKNKKIIRPLLIFSKSEILDFLKRSNLKFYSDPSNKIDTFLRNNIRNNLIPEIEKIEPEIDKRIYRTVSIIQEEYEFFRKLSTDFLSANLICNKILPVSKLLSEPLALRRHIIREFIRILKGNLLNINFYHIEQLANSSGESKGISIPGLTVVKKKGFMYEKKINIHNYRYEIEKETAINIREICSNIVISSTEEFVKPTTNFEIIIPAKKIIYPVVIRNPLSIDKYIKINSDIHQKVFEMIRYYGIPADIRNLLPVIINGNNEPIWVCGSPLSDKYKVENFKRGNFLRIELISPLIQAL